MKRILLLALTLATAAFPVAIAAVGPIGPDALVAAERAFAQYAADHNVRDAFVRFLAPRSVVFDPGPVDAQKFYAAKKPTPALLAWVPATATMSGAGDIGWTTGPWWWRKDHSHRPPDATGRFVTVWRRQADGSYRAVLDMGVSGPDLGDSATVERRTLPGTRTTPGPLSDRRSLWQADAAYAKLAAEQGRAAALAAHAADDVWLLREGHAGVRGHDAARDSLAAEPLTEKLVSTAQFVANSGDLGYTYGMRFVTRDAKTDTSYYLHVWHREAPRPWSLALELVSP